MEFKEADKFKRNNENHREILPILRPVVEKVSSIINNHIKGHDVNEISLVGGTCCLTGIEEIIAKQTGIYTHKPKNPMFATPLGIALSCTQDIIDD
jgi:ethanolamine utilization protein EutJ